MTSDRGTTTTLHTRDGAMETYETGNRDGATGVVLLMDAGGLRPAMRSIADRFAAAGHHVLVPNLYHRQGTFAPFDMQTAFTDPPERERLMSLVRSVTVEGAAADVEACCARLEAAGRGSRVGLVGYCMGGRTAFALASKLPDRVAAAASIHGGGLVKDSPDSPHLGAPAIRAPLYFGVADEDPSCTDDDVEKLRSALDAAHVTYALELYAGAKHGFAAADFPTFDEDAAERHFERVEALFRTALPRR